MKRIPGVPFLPGTLIRDVNQSHFPKVQKLVKIDGVSMVPEVSTPPRLNKLGEVIEVGCSKYQMPSLYPPKLGPKLPTWLAYDKKCLRFYGYFKQTLQEVFKVPYQVRYVIVLFYLEDGTMQVSEPRVRDSGIHQGCLIHRQRILHPPPNQHEFISLLDLNVNSTISIFDRVYHLTSCDLFTRNFLNRLGIHVPDPVDLPEDPSMKQRHTDSKKPFIEPYKHYPLVQFLKFDKKVLKFNAYWHDKSEFGDIRNLEVRFFLTDDTLEVKEIYPPNSGRDAPQIFLKRSKLPKRWLGMPVIGKNNEVTILNVLGNRYKEDILNTGAPKLIYYKDVDLEIGCHLNVYGRDIVLISCDQGTQEYYREKYGIEDFTPLANPALRRRDFDNKKRIDLPPFNGWGTHESSEENCKRIVLKPPIKDLKQFLTLDRLVLRFGAKLLSKITENCDRVFVIAYFLGDDTIRISELVGRNSGWLGGVFFKRKRVYFPKEDMLVSHLPDYYKPHHFFVGGTMNLVDHQFYVVSADEYTLKYMENHPHIFPFACIESVMSKIRENLKPVYKEFVAKIITTLQEPPPNMCECFITYDCLREALVEVMGDKINDHEIITLCRYFNYEDPPTDICDREVVRSAIHLEIQRNIWDDFERFQEHIYQLSPDNNGFLPEKRVRSFLMACRLPFSRDVVDILFRVLNRNPNGEIELCDLVNFMDLKRCPAQPSMPQHLGAKLCPYIEFVGRGKFINFNQFLEKLGLEEDLKLDPH